MARLLLSDIMPKISHTQVGFFLIEAILGIALSAVIVVTTITLIVSAKRSAGFALEQFRANMYASEAIEAVRDLERSDWSSLSGAAICKSAPHCHPETVSNKWALLVGNETLDSGYYTRTLAIEDVYRDSSEFPNNIVPSGTPGAVIDPNTLKVTATVTWTGRLGSRNSVLESYVYNFAF
jgi:type II secretory pathway pseudopilin PulG